MMRILRNSASALLAAATLAAGAAPAAAQDGLSWLWGGGGAVGGSGKQTVSFGRQHAPGQIIVSFSDRRLYLVTSPGVAVSYPIAIPRDQSRWSGVLPITSKRVNPSWTPTPTMRRENPKLPAYVPGGHPLNPMGVRALYLGSSMYRIHGTDAPWTIGQAVSKGCIRMYNQDVVDLYDRVRTGMRVTVTWNRYQSGGAPEYAAAAPSSGSVFSSGFSAESFFSGAPSYQPRAERPARKRWQRSDRPRRATAQRRAQRAEAGSAPAAAGNAPASQPVKQASASKPKITGRANPGAAPTTVSMAE
jgi:lipoprotein-anchoring transpeptidase ErfK/SrfK